MINPDDIIGQAIVGYDDFSTTIFIHLANGKTIEVESIDSEPYCRLVDLDPATIEEREQSK